jgi:glucose-1-phosphate cytidylyltransferase
MGNSEDYRALAIAKRMLLFDYIENDNIPFEQFPLNELVRQGQLNAYVHKGFWQCMDTLREKEKLEKLWNGGNAPWKIWED